MPKVQDIRLKRIIKAVGPLRETDPQAAAGRCLSLSLECARQAVDAWGPDVDLLRWRVRGDPDFLDHWAVLTPCGQALDLTRVQVNGRTELLCDLSDYPAHYGSPARYPASLLMQAYVRVAQLSQPYLPPRFMWRVWWQIHRHDALQAARSGRWPALTRTLTDATRHALLMFAQQFQRALKQRFDTLWSRLERQPEYASHTSRYGQLPDLDLAAAPPQRERKRQTAARSR